jgi:hypothetical protein
VTAAAAGSIAAAEPQSNIELQQQKPQAIMELWQQHQ